MASKYTFKFTDSNKTEFSVYPYTANGPVSPSDNTLIEQAVAQTTTLKLYGKGMQDYGEGIEQNMIYMLENFANATAPINPIEGQMWYDNIGVTGSPIIGAVGPQLNIYNSTTWDAIILATGTSHMTGELILAADPIEDLGAVPKQMLDAHTNDSSAHITSAQDALLNSLVVGAAEINTLFGISGTGSPITSPVTTIQDQFTGKVSVVGDTMTGDLIITGGDLTLNVTGSPETGGNVIMNGGEVLGLPATPSATGAASREYVDAQIAAGGADGVLTNVEDVSTTGSPIITVGNNTLRFTVTGGGSPSILEIDGISRVGHIHNASEITFTPGSPQNIINTNVQDAILELDFEKASTTGTTFTGAVNINSTLNVTGAAAFTNTLTANSPAADSDVATKLYVDTAIVGGITVPVLTITRTLETLGSPITTPTPYAVQGHNVDDNKLAITINGQKQYVHTHSTQNILFDVNALSNFSGLDNNTLYDFAINIDGGSPITTITINPATSPLTNVTTLGTLLSAINDAMTSASPQTAQATFIFDIINGIGTFTTYSSGGSSSISISDPGTANTYLFATDPSPAVIIGANFISDAQLGSPNGSPLPTPDDIIVSGDETANFAAGTSFTIRGSNDSVYGSYDSVYRVHDNGPVYSGSPDQTLIPIAAVSDSSVNTPLFSGYTPGASPLQTVPMTGSPAQFGTTYLTTLGAFDQIATAVNGIGGDYKETDSLGNSLPPGDGSSYVVFDVTIPSTSQIETLLYS